MLILHENLKLGNILGMANLRNNISIINNPQHQ